MPKREWDEIDEQMEREGDAVNRRMNSIAQTPGGKHVSKDKLVPCSARGVGDGESFRPSRW